jgi:hypothetical protein
MGFLLREFSASVGRMSAKTDRYLTDLGIPRSVIYGGASPIGVERAQVTENGCYQPTEDGAQVLVTPVGWRGPGGVMWEAVDDLVAFNPRDPSLWWRRQGVGPFLNPEALERATYYGDLLPVFSTPLSWLRAGMQGIVILDWEGIHTPLHLGGIKVFACETSALAGRLIEALRDVKPCPQFRLIKSEVFAHAA